MKRLAFAAAALSLAACSKPAPAPAPAPKPAPAPVAAVAKPTVAPVAKPAPPPPLDSNSAEVVLARLHAIDAQELAAAQLAKSNAQHKQVKSLAADISTARTRFDAQVSAVAKKLSVNLATPDSMNLAAADKQDAQAIQSEWAALSSKKGADFDAAFLAAAEDADKREDALLSSAAAKSASADIKSLATAQRATLQKQEKVAGADLKALTPRKSTKKI